jgi:hypothetical protein
MAKRLLLLAVPIVAGAAVTLATSCAWAFTQETLNPNGNYNFNYGPLDDKAKSGLSTDKSDSNSPGFHFGVEGNQQTSPFGFRSFGGDRVPDPPGYYSHPPGNGN